MNTESRPAPIEASRLIWGIVLIALIAFPLRIISYGYLPTDDTLRHAAKAISGKPWTEILVLRPEITIDHNPGWNWLLTSLHHVFGWDGWTLVTFSIAFLFALLTLSPLVWIRRPESWLSTLAILLLVFPYFVDRTLSGRPYLVSVAAVLVLLSMWTKLWPTEKLRIRLGGTVAIFALATWIHGAWYLLPLLPAAFFLAREWRKGALLTASWTLGTLLGAILTGHPWTFLQQSALIPILAAGQPAPPEFFVTEFQRFSGHYPALILVAFVLGWRQLTGKNLKAIGRDPVLWLALAGYVLGYWIVRFWLDWGLPALALWLTRQIEELTHSWSRPLQRVGLCFIAAAALFLGPGSNRHGRWSQANPSDWLDSRRPELAGWLPDPGGILYAVDLSAFYQTFYCNPQANWRYALGFEPSFMTPENLAVYTELCRSLNAIKACEPWVQRMSSADRLVLTANERTRPAIPKLEWLYTGNNTWIGRVKRLQ